ncbi:MAG TPA: AgmX/PglI C-terminal domain-containing protein [Gammaproteobacteria bacterium]
MAYAAVQYRHYDLPWTLAAEQEERFKRVLKGTLGAVLALALLVSLLPVPEPDPAVVEEIPPRFARLVLERVEPPPPPPPVVRDEPEPVPEPEPVVEREVTEAPPPLPEPERVVEEPPPAPQPENRVEQARERARSAGVLPFAEQLAALRDTALLDDLAGPQTTVTSAAADAPAAPERSLITSRAGASSGGINTAALSRDTGGVELAGRTTTRVESPVEGAAPSGSGSAAGGGGGDAPPARSREEIERVFDQNKSAIYALYHRALRENPSLEGKLVLRLTIAPDGTVTACEVVSSELNDPELEQRLVQRVMLFRFEPKDVAPVTTTKPIDFFPG